MTLLEARQIIKDGLRKRGKKISHYKAEEITEAAREYLKQINAKSKS